MPGALALDAAGIEPHVPAVDGSRPVLIDDADQGALDETGLFHLINAVRGAGTTSASDGAAFSRRPGA